jgi:hypothetical protein
VTYKRCQDRRAARCESCSREYRGDAWHLVVCGLAGGKGLPESVAEHPATFGTLTAPSFGLVHGVRQSGPCRARRNRPTCAHGRPAYCLTRHRDGDPRLGEPLCVDCYDYLSHVLWQWHAPELWRRFAIALRRRLAAEAGLTPHRLAERARLAYVKVSEFQARGLVHFHTAARLDGPTGPDRPPAVDLDAGALSRAFVDTAAAVTLTVVDPVRGGRLVLRFGAQVDARPLTPEADREGQDGPAHPAMAAAYLSKYLTKSTEDLRLPWRVATAAHAAAAGARTHAVRILQAAEQLVDGAADLPRGDDGEPDDLVKLAGRFETLGYRGHPVTKTRAYSTTFARLRAARAEHRRRDRHGLDPDARIRDTVDVDQDERDDDTAELVVSEWTYAGRGYLDLPTAGAAALAACRARTRGGADPIRPGLRRPSRSCDVVGRSAAGQGSAEPTA